jgi:hypothetical protein
MSPGQTQVTIGLITFCLAAFLAGGCTHTFVLDSEALSAWPPHHKLDLAINLLLTDEFTKSIYDKEIVGEHYVFLLGAPLAVNAEAMTKEAFAEVTVTRGTKPDAKGMDAVLTPSVAAIEHAMSVWAVEDVEMTIDVRWTLTDPQGQVLWVRTVRGTGKHVLGNILTDEAGKARKRVGKVIADLFTKSLLAITTAPELRGIQERHTGSATPETPRRHP